MVTTSRCTLAKSSTDLGTGTTQRGSITVAPIPWAASNSATLSAVSAMVPTATSKTSLLGASYKTSTPSFMRRSCFISAPAAPFGKRTTVGASSTFVASCNSSRKRSASRGAAILMPGTICRVAKSHMPWCEAPSGPVTPARSSTSVTGALCNATSMRS